MPLLASPLIVDGEYALRTYRIAKTPTLIQITLQLTMSAISPVAQSSEPSARNVPVARW
jgi:hypothetical protein